MAVNVLMIAHYFTLEVSPASHADALPFSPLPSMKPTAKLKFRVAEQTRELSVWGMVTPASGLGPGGITDILPMLEIAYVMGG